MDRQYDQGQQIACCGTLSLLLIESQHKLCIAYLNDQQGLRPLSCTDHQFLGVFGYHYVV